MPNRKLPVSLLTAEKRDDYGYHDPQATRLIKFLQSKSETCTLDDCLRDIYRYPTFYGLEYINDGVRVVKGETIVEGELTDNGEMDFISPEDATRFPRTILAEGDLVMSVRGTMGKAAVVPAEFAGGVINANLIRMQLNDHVDPFYLHAYLTSRIGQMLIERQSTKAIQSTITVPFIKAIPVWMPDKKTQRRIAQILRDAFKERNELLEQAMKTVFDTDNHVMSLLGISEAKISKITRTKLRISDLVSRDDQNYHNEQAKSLITQVAEGQHPSKRIGDIIALIKYGTSIKNDYVPVGVPFLRVTNLLPNDIDLEDILYLSDNPETVNQIGNAYVYENDLLITRSGTVGIVARVPKEADSFAYGSYLIKFRLTDGYNPEYVAAIFNNFVGRVQTEREKSGAVQANINIGGIKRILIPFPDEIVQNAVVKEVVRRRDEAKRLRAQAKDVVRNAKSEIERIVLGNEQ